jgi:hypothetical protein
VLVLATYGMVPSVRGAAAQEKLLWAVDPPPGKWVLQYNDSVPFAISTGEQIVRGVRIVSSTLQETTSGKARTGTTLTASADALASIEKALSPATLEEKGFIPAAIPNPLRSAVDRTADYRAYLDGLGARLTALELIRSGMKRALASWSTNAEVQGAVRKALAAIDAAAQNLADPNQVRQQIESALTVLGQELTALAVGGGSPGPLSSPSTVDLRVQVRRLSLATWLIWAIVTWALGYVILISTNYSFGVGSDLFKCFFWGLGLPVAGQQMLQLTPSSISSAFSVSFPKV